MGTWKDINKNTEKIEKYLYGALLFIAGVIIGWLNPIEGPLDWTYDEYASQPAHKYPAKVAPEQPKTPQYGIDTPDVEDIKEVLIDLNENGEQEWYLFLPLLKGNK